jgi:hypothetical protein
MTYLSWNSRKTGDKRTGTELSQNTGYLEKATEVAFLFVNLPRKLKHVILYNANII